MTVPDPGELQVRGGTGGVTAQLQVRGGTGGVTAQLIELQRAGTLLRDVAGELAGRSRMVAAVSLDPRLQLSAPLSPVTFARAEVALAAATFGPGGLLATAARVELLGTAAVTVAGAYRTADAAAAGAISAAARLSGQAAGVAVGVLAPGFLLAAAATIVTVAVSSGQLATGRPDAEGTRHPRGDANARAGGTLPGPLRRIGGLTLRLLADHAVLTEAAIPVLPPALRGFTSTAPQAAPWFQESTAVQVRATATPWHRPSSGAGELLGRIPISAGDPKIHVERVEGVAAPAGTLGGRHWVVAIPGTADWSPVAGRNPLDLTGNVRLMAGERTAGMAGVVAAMRETGVRKGEPVLVVGHSQGGLIAAALAADASVRREFTVTQVITSGAPVASMRVPDGVQVLSIEHSDDLVPRLDGSSNRDRPNWITVTAPAMTGDLPVADRSEPLLAHRTELYRGTAERIDASTDPALMLWRAQLAPFLDGPGRSGASWDVEISRAVAPEPTPSR